MRKVFGWFFLIIAFLCLCCEVLCVIFAACEYHALSNDPAVSGIDFLGTYIYAVIMMGVAVIGGGSSLVATLIFHKGKLAVVSAFGAFFFGLGLIFAIPILAMCL